MLCPFKSPTKEKAPIRSGRTLLCKTFYRLVTRSSRPKLVSETIQVLGCSFGSAEGRKWVGRRGLEKASFEERACSNKNETTAGFVGEEASVNREGTTLAA